MIAGESVSLAAITATNQRTNYPLPGFVCMSLSLPIEMGFIGIKSKKVFVCKRKINTCQHNDNDFRHNSFIITQ